VADNSRQFASLLQQGLALHQAGRLEEALTLYQRAAALDARNADLHRFRGMAFGRLGRFDKAQASYEQALMLNPTDPSTHYNQANLSGIEGIWRARSRASKLQSRSSRTSSKPIITAATCSSG
jgi:Flp pilus assembly protein TadD